MALREVRRTYLEMTRPDALVPGWSGEAGLRTERVEACPASFFRYLYVEVGRAYHWIDRLAWSDEQIRRHLADPAVSLWGFSVRGAPAGYFELKRYDDGAVEIAYFGLLPDFHGRGFGKHLLTAAATEGWAIGATRLWLHTCTLDAPEALPNYVKRGFRAFKEETYFIEVAPV